MTSKSTQFVQDRLTVIFKNHPHISFRYEFRDYLNTHIVEVLPFDSFENDLEFIQAEIDLNDEFDYRFPNEDILFISSESLIEIENSSFELKSEL